MSVKLTTPNVMDLLQSAREALGSEIALVVEREKLAAFCGKRELSEREMEALVQFVNCIAFDLTTLELLENRDVDFYAEGDGRIHWLNLSVPDGVDGG